MRLPCGHTLIMEKTKLSAQLIEDLLRTIIHPTTEQNIIDMGVVENLKIEDERVSMTLRMPRKGDVAMNSLRRGVISIIEQKTGITPSVILAEPQNPNSKAAQRAALKENSTLGGVKKVIAISSGKGGVGKSSMTTSCAVALAKKGYRVGVLDADIYGPSMPLMFGNKDYMPVTSAQSEGENSPIEPAERYGVKVMSIGYFIKDTDALVWRGPMATSALRQLIHQSAWGELDFLLIDLPPGTSDIHLTVVGELNIDAAIIVTTPQMVALADVVRGIEMFRSEHVAIPVLGIVENMAYFEAKGERYYIFGRGKIESVAEETGLEVICSVPILEGMADGGDSGEPLALSHPELFGGVVGAIEKLL